MELHEHTDSQLVVRLQAEDDAAFEELMRRYQRPVLNFCYRLLGNETDAAEIAQESFVRLYQQRAKIDARRELSTWLFALARNACIDRLRWRHRHPAEPLEAAPEPAVDAREVQTRELGHQIAAAIARLPEEQRTVVVLAEYHGRTYAQIAAIMRCSEKSVETRLYRAKQTLRGHLHHLLD